jgi:hypothetical protein
MQTNANRAAMKLTIFGLRCLNIGSPPYNRDIERLMIGNVSGAQQCAVDRDRSAKHENDLRGNAIFAMVVIYCPNASRAVFRKTQELNP